MFKFVVFVALVASASAGVLQQTVLSAPVGAVAVGPALGATLLGRTTINAPETTIVKQQVVVDQPEIRYRAVPTLVQQVVAAPQLVAAPQQVIARSVLAAPQVVAPQLVAAPQQVIARSVLAAPQVVSPQLLASPQVLLRGNSIQTVASPLALSSQLVAGIGSQTLLASPTQTLLSSPTVLALKK